MRRSATLIGMAVLGLVGCQGGDEATSVERPETTTVVTTTPPPGQAVLSPEDRLLGWIRSCEVRRIGFTHERGVYIGFTNGGTVRLRSKERAEDKLLAATFRQRCGWDARDGRILVVME
jgi:hypothetical protein